MRRPIQKTGKHAGKPYRKSQKAYAIDYKVSLPTVKRWWGRGLPCDGPAAMGEHLSPRGRKPAESDADFEAPSIAAPPLDDPDAAPSSEAEPDAPVQLDESFFQGRGLLAEIEPLQDAARERRGAYFNAIRFRRGSLNIRNRLAEWMSVLEALRKVEKDLPGILKANHRAVDRAEMELVIGQVFQAFRAQTHVAFTRLVEKLGLGADPDAQDAAGTEQDRLLRTLAGLKLPGDPDDPDASGPTPALADA